MPSGQYWASAAADESSAAAELRARHRRRRGAVLVAEVDPAFAQIIRRHLYRNAVAGEDADAVFLHPARRIGERFMAVVETHAKPRVGKQFEDRSLEFEQVFFSQKRLLF